MRSMALPWGIRTIRARVVQTAAKLLLEPVFEADLDAEAYGDRRRAPHGFGMTVPRQ